MPRLLNTALTSLILPATRSPYRSDPTREWSRHRRVGLACVLCRRVRSSAESCTAVLSAEPPWVQNSGDSVEQLRQVVPTQQDIRLLRRCCEVPGAGCRVPFNQL